MLWQGFPSTTEGPAAIAQQFWQLQASMRDAHLEDLAYVARLLHQNKAAQKGASVSSLLIGKY